MADARPDIPNRESFKASEVCVLAGVKPYVLHSWEQEFPTMGTSRSKGAPRVYRRRDLERVLRIKELVFGHGLTLAGARRQIEEEEGEDGPQPETAVVGADARRKLDGIKQELRDLLEMLGGAPIPRRQGSWLPPPIESGRLGFDENGSGVLPSEADARRGAGRRKKAPHIRAAE